MSEPIVEHERQREDLSRTTSTIDLWLAMVGGPASGMLMVWVNYPLVDRACVGGNRLWLHGASFVFLLMALTAGIFAWRLYNRVGDYPLTEGGVMPRVRFMALVGLFTSGLAIIEITMQWIPIFFLGSCIGA